MTGIPPPGFSLTHPTADVRTIGRRKDCEANSPEDFPTFPTTGKVAHFQSEGRRTRRADDAMVAASVESGSHPRSFPKAAFGGATISQRILSSLVERTPLHQ